MLGLTESFSANYYCRFCLGKKSDLKSLVTEDASLLRCQSDYQNHVMDKEFGVKEECLFNNLKYFHIYTNTSVDVMHDLYEGVSRYDMSYN